MLFTRVCSLKYSNVPLWKAAAGVKNAIIINSNRRTTMQVNVRSFSLANTHSTKTNCAVCGTEIDCCQQICSKCNKITNAHDEKCKDCSHFEVLGLEKAYQVDRKVLEKRFKDLQMLLHPDKYETGTAREKLNSSIHSSRTLFYFILLIISGANCVFFFS